MEQTDVGDVTRPNLVRPVNYQSFQQVGINFMFRAGPAGPWLGIDGLKPHEPHQAPDPFCIHPMPLIPKPVPHFFNSESRPAGKLLIYQTHQIIIVSVIPSGPVIKR